MSSQVKKQSMSCGLRRACGHVAGAPLTAQSEKVVLFGKSGSRKFACLDLYSFSTNFSIWKLWIQVKYFTSPGISVQCLDPLYPKSACWDSLESMDPLIVIWIVK